MKTKLFILCIALVASEGIMFASTKIGSLYYNLDAANQTAEVTYQEKNSSNNYSGLTRINIPRTVTYNAKTFNVTSIGEYAFCGCSGSTSVTIPNSITSIGNNAFLGCSSLTSISIPNSVTSIGNRAFSGCKSMTTMTIPNSITSIGDRVFSGCSGLINVIIPSSIVSIGNYAFSNCTSLTSVTIPNSVTNIGECAFYCCTSLISPVYNSHLFAYMPTSYSGVYTIPNGVESIVGGAFKDHTGLTSVTIPNSVISIESRAFEGCTSLTSVAIGNSVTSIGGESFSGCVALSSIIFGDSVKQIGEKAFYHCSSLNSVIFPNSVTIIDDNAFYECDNLAYLHFGDSLKILGSEVFMNCHNLRNFILPESLKIIRNKSFYGCNSIDSVTIPTNVDSVGYAVLADCTNLRYIKWNAIHANCIYREDFYNLCFLSYLGSKPLIGDIRDSIKTFEFGSQVEVIPQYLCFQMKNIDSLYIPQNVRLIGSRAFYECIKLRKIVVADNNETFDSRYNCNSIIKKDSSKLVVGSGCSFIPNDVAIIGMEAFMWNQLLTSIHIPSNVELIEGRAFCGCKLQNLILDEGIKQIWSSAFMANTHLTEITFPSSVSVFGRSIFSGCFNLKEITYNNVIIGESMFYNCTGLTSVVIPDNVREMRESAFSHCRSLEEITVGKGLRSLPNYAFYTCDNLRKIDIGENIDTIGSNAFDNCDSIKEIYVRPYDPPIFGGVGVEYRDRQKIKVYVPCDRLETYAATLSWSGYNLMYDSVLYNLTGLSNDTIGGYVKVTNELCNNTLEAVPYESYEFVQWSDGNTDNPRTIMLTRDTTITAIFATQTFTITFVDDNDTILSTQEYEYGAMPLLPADPVKTNDAQYSYTFAGWSPQIVTVTSDATYKATYTSTLNKYTITFMNGDSILSADLWEYGKMPIYRGEVPTKEEDDKYTYAFNGWSPEIVSVVADATYSATYTASEKTEAVRNIPDKSMVPSKIVDKGTIYILMPNGKKYSIIGELIK